MVIIVTDVITTRSITEMTETLKWKRVINKLAGKMIEEKLFKTETKSLPITTQL